MQALESSLFEKKNVKHNLALFFHIGQIYMRDKKLSSACSVHLNFGGLSGPADWCAKRGGSCSLSRFCT